MTPRVQGLTEGYSSRREECRLFVCPRLNGSQAEYLRVPWADATAVTAAEGIDEGKHVLMADISSTN